MLCHALEVVQGLIVDATLGMAAVISGVAVAAALPHRGCAEETSRSFNSSSRSSKKRGLWRSTSATHKPGCAPRQGLQMKVTIYEELSSLKLWGQVKFSPEVAAAAGKHRPGAGLVTMQALRQFEDSMQVGPGAAVLAGVLRLVQGSANQVFRENGFFAMRFVLRSARLEIETQSCFIPVGVK